MKNKDIGIGNILAVLRKKIKWIVAITLFCGIFMWLVSAVIMKTVYTSTVSLYIYSSADRNQQGNSDITSSELSASQLLADTYIVILESDTVLEEVSNKLNLDFSTEKLKGMISAAPINNTEVIAISVEDTDPERAQKIANTIAEVLPEKLIQIVKAGGVEVVDYARLPIEPTSPNIFLYVTAGLLFGAFFSFGLFILKEYWSTKVEGEEDLVNAFDIEIPVLGKIPMLDGKKVK